jgi:hypothetical protein
MVFSRGGCRGIGLPTIAAVSKTGGYEAEKRLRDQNLGMPGVNLFPFSMVPDGRPAPAAP